MRKQSQIDQIKNYINQHLDLFRKVVVFGKCITEECTEDDILEIAIEFENEDEQTEYNFLCFIDEVTDGKFDLSFLNEELFEEQVNQIQKGEILYEKE